MDGIGLNGTGLDGRTAVVTGGAGGMGRAICADLAALGARVLVADLDEAGAGGGGTASAASRPPSPSPTRTRCCCSYGAAARARSSRRDLHRITF